MFSECGPLGAEDKVSREISLGDDDDGKNRFANLINA